MIRVEDAFHLYFGFKLMCMHNTSNPSPLDKRPPINASKKKAGSWEIFQPVTFEVKRPTKNFLYFLQLRLASPAATQATVSSLPDKKICLNK